jgi:hypothetical protein
MGAIWSRSEYGASETISCIEFRKQLRVVVLGGILRLLPVNGHYLRPLGGHTDFDLPNTRKLLYREVGKGTAWYHPRIIRAATCFGRLYILVTNKDAGLQNRFGLGE